MLDALVEGSQPLLAEYLDRRADPPAGDAQIMHRFRIESAQRAQLRRMRVGEPGMQQELGRRAKRRAGTQTPDSRRFRHRSSRKARADCSTIRCAAAGPAKPRDRASLSVKNVASRKNFSTSSRISLDRSATERILPQRDSPAGMVTRRSFR